MKGKLRRAQWLLLALRVLLWGMIMLPGLPLSSETALNVWFVAALFAAGVWFWRNMLLRRLEFEEKYKEQ